MTTTETQEDVIPEEIITIDTTNPDITAEATIAEPPATEEVTEEEEDGDGE